MMDHGKTTEKMSWKKSEMKECCTLEVRSDHLIRERGSVYVVYERRGLHMTHADSSTHPLIQEK